MARGMFLKINWRRLRSRTVVLALAPLTVLSIAMVSAASPASAATVLAQGQIVNAYIEDACLSSNFAGSVYTTTCSGVKYHQWQQMSNGETRNVGTGLCLSANAQDVYTVKCSDSIYHLWDYVPVRFTNPTPYRLTNIGMGAELSMNFSNDVYLAGPNGAPAHEWWFI